MNDPHVEALIYQIGTANENISYGDPPPVFFSNDLGEFELKDGILLVRSADHHANIEEVRDVNGPFLRTWEMHAELNSNPGQLRFRYQTAKVIDRNPSPIQSGNIEVTVQDSALVLCRDHVTLSITCNKYPEAPTAFASSSDVELAHGRWVRYSEGSKEPLQSMSYFVCAMLEQACRGRRGAAKVYSVDFTVLSKIGELSAEKGDADTARKAGFTQMLISERKWLHEAAKRLVLRLSEHASRQPLTKITMDDLPDLES